MIAAITAKKDKYITMCSGSLLPDRLKVRFAALIEERAVTLEG